ncbi:hypothetical protein Dimus_000378 [Dionaea muscipula]
MSDSVERFHISSFLLFVLAQNLLEAEGAWFGNFLSVKTTCAAHGICFLVCLYYGTSILGNLHPWVVNKLQHNFQVIGFQSATTDRWLWYSVYASCLNFLLDSAAAHFGTWA